MPLLAHAGMDAAPVTPPKRRPRGTGGLTYRASDGMWIGRVDFGTKPNGKRDRRPVASRDRDVAQRKLDALVAELNAQRDPLMRAAAGIKPKPGRVYTVELEGGRPIVYVSRTRAEDS